MTRSSLALPVIILIAAVLRFWGLENSSLWTDELSSWVNSHPGLLSEVINRVQSDGHPPAYFAMLHYVILYLGDSEFWLRLPSVLSGIAAVYCTFMLGANLYSRSVGLISAAVMAVSWAPIFYSQEARAYSLFLLVGIALLYYWQTMMRAFEKGSDVSFSVYAAYFVVAVFACYLHYFGLQLVVIQLGGFVMLFLMQPQVLVRVGLLSAMIVLAYAPWIPSMIHQMEIHNSHWIPESTMLKFAESMVEFAYKIDPWAIMILIAPAYAVAMKKGITTIGFPGSIRKIRLTMFTPGGLLTLWIVIPFLAAYVQSMVIRPIMLDRYLIFVLPAMYILLARGIEQVPTVWGRWWAGVICLVIVASLIFDEHYYARPQKDQYREASKYVIAAGDTYGRYPIIAYTWQSESFDYYLEKSGSSRRVALLAGTMDDIAKVETTLQAKNADGFWYLVGQRNPQPEFLKQLGKKYILQKELHLMQASARLYKQREY